MNHLLATGEGLPHLPLDNCFISAMASQHRFSVVSQYSSLKGPLSAFGPPVTVVELWFVWSIQVYDIVSYDTRNDAWKLCKDSHTCNYVTI